MATRSADLLSRRARSRRHLATPMIRRPTSTSPATFLLLAALALGATGCMHPAHGPSQAEIDDYTRMERAASNRAKPDGALRSRDAWDPETYGKPADKRFAPAEPPLIDRPFGTQP